MSVGVVGLSLLTASVALAAPNAPEGGAAKKPTTVAQAKKAKAPKAGKASKAKVAPATEAAAPALNDEEVQAADPAPVEGGGTPPTTAPADPAPAPAAAEPAPPAAAAAEPAAEPATPAIVIGNPTGVPGADTPGASAADPGKKEKARPWAGTQVFLTSSMTTATIDRSQNQYSNPTVDGSIWLQPRYAINEAFQLRGLLVFSYEFTNADDTVTKNEPRFSDTSLSLYYRKIPELPGGIKPAVALSVSLPSSPESRARTNVFTPGFSAQLSKSVEHVIGGNLDFLLVGAYSHPVYRNTTPEIRGSAPYAFQCVGGDSCQDQLSGTYNVSDQIRYSAIISGEWGKWSPALFYRGTSAWAYHGKDVTVGDVTRTNDGTVVQSTSGFAPTHVRQGSYFSAWLDYNANAWFTAEAGYWLERSALGGDGQRGNLFFDKYQDQRVFVGVSLNIDNIMKQLEGGPAEAGIVRARNKTGPIGAF